MSMKKSQSIIVFQDKAVNFVGLFLFLVMSATSVWGLYITTLPSNNSLTDTWILRIILICIGLCFPVLYVVDPDRYFVWYRFSQECITYHTLFRRKKVIPYSALPYVMHGKYFHMVYWRHYIVFSNRRLKASELEQINHVSPSSTLLKVKCSKKTCRALASILPAKYRSVVAAIQFD